MSYTRYLPTIREMDSETPASTPDADLVDLYVAEMRAEGCRDRTINGRVENLALLRRFAGKPLVTLQRADLIAFLGRPHLAASTKQRYRADFRIFFTFVQDEGYRIDNPAGRLPRVRVIRNEPNPFTTEEVQDLLATPMYRRARMMVLLATLQGFRATEIAAVRGENIRWEAGMILTAEAKNGHEVWRPLHPMVLEQAVHFPREGFWFPGRVSAECMALDPSKHVAANAVSRVLSDVIKRAGLSHHRPHQLRGWHATELLDSGANPLVVQHSMRHGSAQTLHRYIRPNQERIREAITALPTLKVADTSGRKRKTT